MASPIFETLLPILAITTMMCNSHPVVEEHNPRDMPSVTDLLPNKARQEEVGEFGGEVGAQVGQIVNGVFTANVGDIFSGTLSFIDDGDVQTGVGTIFESLTQPLNTLWAAGNKQTLKYFGITDPTTANPLLANKTATATATGAQAVPAQGAAVPVAAAVPAPAPVAAVVTTEEPDEDGGEDTENRRLHA